MGPDGGPLTTAELYDPATSTFRAASAVPGRRFEATVTPVGGASVLVAGGNDGTISIATLDVLRPTVGATTVTLRVRTGCDTAQVFRGRGPEGLPRNDRTGRMVTTHVATLQPRDLVSVDEAPVAGASYDSGCTGATDYRWYRVRAVNGRVVSGWSAAQVLKGGTDAVPAEPLMLHWADPELIAMPSFDDVTVDDQGVVHAVTLTRTGLIHTTDAGGIWISSPLERHADLVTHPRTVYEGQPAIDAAGGVVAVAYELRYRGPGDCAPDPCWEGRGVAVAVLRAGGWTIHRLATSGHRPAVAVQGGHVYVVYSDRRGDEVYATDTSGSWRSERIPGVRSEDQMASIALDRQGRPHVAFGGVAAPSAISYAVRRAGGWSVRTVERGPATLDRVSVAPDGAVQISYTGVRDRSPDELCFSDCSVPIDFHLRSPHGSGLAVLVVPGAGFGTFAVDADGRPSVLRWAARLAWRAQRPGTWLSRSWDQLVQPSTGPSIDPVRRQWIDIVGDKTYLVFRQADDATWMITGTNAAERR